MKTTYEFKQLNLDAEYASQVMNQIPYGWIDKSICGCGLTTVALENDRDTIVAVPSVLLATNKEKQYPNTRCPYKILAVHGDLDKDDVLQYIYDCYTSKQPFKIIITYDSLWKVEDIVINQEQVDLVIDESDRLLAYAKMKAESKKDTGNDVLTTLYNLAYKVKERVSFISATPIPLEYMPKWISELPLVKMNWSSTFKSVPLIMKRAYPFQALRRELIKPINSQGFAEINGEVVKKLIIFINSVTEISSILDNMNVPVEKVAVLAGNSLNNSIKLRKYKVLEDCSNLPEFTFITSTGFQGIDLYDKDAISVVVSNTQKKFTMIDLATDLKQAISRQRDKTNKFYGKYIFIYNQTVFEEKEEDLLKQIEEERKDIQVQIETYNFNIKSEQQAYIDGIMKFASNDYKFKCYSIVDENTGLRAINEQIFNADKYFLLEVRRQFVEGVDMRSSLVDTRIALTRASIERVRLEFADYARQYKEKKSWENAHDNKEWKNLIESCYKLTGSVPHRTADCKEKIEFSLKPQKNIKSLIQSAFTVGQRYSRAEIKEKLQAIYQKEKINRVAKYSDIAEHLDFVDKKVQGERYCQIVARK